ncbi:MAG: secondary thiamine-phosphate synthase enzyme YjbQ [Pseudomonadales bacterium]
MWQQHNITLRPRKRGFHLITEELQAQLPQLADINIGLLHLYIQHSSASLTINENADPSVRVDFEAFFSQAVPENEPYYTHTYEGPDDMPAHIKASLLGASLSIPITQGRLNMGIWQGVYLCEHRDRAGARTLIATLHGE